MKNIFKRSIALLLAVLTILSTSSTALAADSIPNTENSEEVSTSVTDEIVQPETTPPNALPEQGSTDAPPEQENSEEAITAPEETANPSETISSESNNIITDTSADKEVPDSNKTDGSTTETISKRVDNKIFDANGNQLFEIGTTIKVKNNFNVVLKDNAGNYIAGAKFAIKDIEGNVIDEWITEAPVSATDDSNTKHAVTLPDNKSYFLVQETANKGFAKNSDIEFIANPASEIKELTFTNKKIQLAIVDANNNFAEGISTVFYDDKGNEVFKTTSEKANVDLNNLQVNKIYTIKLTDTLKKYEAMTSTILVADNASDQVISILLTEKSSEGESPVISSETPSEIIPKNNAIIEYELIDEQSSLTKDENGDDICIIYEVREDRQIPLKIARGFLPSTANVSIYNNGNIIKQILPIKWHCDKWTDDLSTKANGTFTFTGTFDSCSFSDDIKTPSIQIILNENDYPHKKIQEENNELPTLQRANTPSTYSVGGFEYSYSGNSQFIDDGNGNWRLKLLSSGTLTIRRLGNASNGIDVFLVGAGGGGYQSAGGGAGYTKTVKKLSVSETSYSITIGQGNYTGSGNPTSAFGYSASGGRYGSGNNGGNGGSGGGSENIWNTSTTGGSDGSNGQGRTDRGCTNGTGQHTTTREFGESSGTLYAGGGSASYVGYPSSSGTLNSYYTETPGSPGGGGSSGTGGNPNNGWPWYGGSNGASNTGGGGGSGGTTGGSGIVVIRNTRHRWSGWSNWSNYSSSQHRRYRTCSECGATEYDYAAHTYISSVTQQPTCTATGIKEYTCSTCGYSYTESIPALNHNWKSPTYTWGKNNSSCTAKRVCARNTSHTETANGTVSSKQTIAPTMDNTGQMKYTAQFDKNWAATQTKYVTVPMLPSGTLQIVAHSTDTSLTNLNPNFDTTTATYNIYRDAQCSQNVGSIKTSNEKIKLSPGIYYLKEIKQADGFAPFTQIQKIEIKEGKAVKLDQAIQPLIGGIEITVSSANPEITNNNSMYSLKNIEYGLFVNEQDTQPIKTIQIENGKATNNSMPFGKYFIKEITNTLGYEANKKAMPVTIQENKTAKLSFSKIPHVLNVSKPGLRFMIKTVGTTPDEDMSNIMFKISYYDKNCTIDNNHMPTGDWSQPTRTWIFQTKYGAETSAAVYAPSPIEEFYRVMFDDPNCFVSGDNLYKTDTGEIVLPLGSLLIEEIQTQDGYRKSGGSWAGLCDTSYSNPTNKFAAKIWLDQNNVTLNDPDCSNPENFLITRYKEPTRILVNSVDTSGNVLKGAKLHIEDLNGNVIIPEWTTTNASRVIEKQLISGQTYKLVQSGRLNGYVTARSVDFTVDDSLAQQIIQVVNKPIAINVSLQNMQDANLPGAVLYITDETGAKVIPEWTTTNQTSIIKGLELNKTYYLIEKNAPEGYTKAFKTAFKLTDTEKDQYVYIKNIKGIGKTEPVIDENTGKISIAIDGNPYSDAEFSVTFDKPLPPNAEVVLTDKNNQTPIFYHYTAKGGETNVSWNDFERMGKPKNNPAVPATEGDSYYQIEVNFDKASAPNNNLTIFFKYQRGNEPAEVITTVKNVPIKPAINGNITAQSNNVTINHVDGDKTGQDYQYYLIATLTQNGQAIDAPHNAKATLSNIPGAWINGNQIAFPVGKATQTIDSKTLTLQISNLLSGNYDLQWTLTKAQDILNAFEYIIDAANSNLSIERNAKPYMDIKIKNIDGVASLSRVITNDIEHNINFNIDTNSSDIEMTAEKQNTSLSLYLPVSNIKCSLNGTTTGTIIIPKETVPGTYRITFSCSNHIEDNFYLTFIVKNAS